MQFKKELYLYFLIVHNQINRTTILAYSTICIVTVRWVQDKGVEESPSTGSSDTAR